MKHKRRTQKKPAPLDPLDRLHEHCRAILAVAGLLRLCTDPMEASLVNRAGELMERETEALRALLESKEAQR